MIIKELPMYDGPDVLTEDIITVYVVINGSLGMSAGKIAAQTYHCGWLACAVGTNLVEWVAQGRRVSVRIADTDHTFQRVMEECDGYAQRDEGVNEVEHGTVTTFVTIPYRRNNTPKILAHKRVQAYK